MELLEKRFLSGFPTIQYQAGEELIKKPLSFPQFVPYLSLHHVQQLVLDAAKRGLLSRDLVIKEFISAGLVECVAELDVESLRVFLPKQVGSVLAILDQKLESSPIPSSLVQVLLEQCRSQTLSWMQRVVPLRDQFSLNLVQELEKYSLLERVELGSWDQMESIHVLDSLLGSGGVDIDVFGHVVLQRATILWIEKQFLDSVLLDILERVLDSPVQELLLRTVIVVMSTIAMDRHDNLLWKIMKKALLCIPGSLIGRLALLPCLQTLMMTTKIAEVTEVLKLVQEIEDDRQSRIDYDLIVDPTYGIFVQCASSDLITHTDVLSAVDSVPGLKSVVLGAQCLLPERNVYRTLEYFNQHILQFRKQDMLTFLGLYMYLAKEKMEHYLVTECIPQLTLCNDAFVTAAVIQFISQICEPRQRVTYLERTGIESLLNVYKLQKRVWGHLKTTLFRWGELYKKSDRGRVKDEDEIEIEDDLQIYVCELILELCTDQNCARDLLPLIVSLLKPRGLDRHITLGLEFLLDAFLECIQVGVTTPQASLSI
jgi:hypothetical protein